MLTHGNLLHNQREIRRGFGYTAAEPVVVVWLPLYHDMGLIGGMLQPLYVRRPVRADVAGRLPAAARCAGCAAISRYRATTSGGPNFAYDLCVRQHRAGGARRRWTCRAGRWRSTAPSRCAPRPWSASPRRSPPAASGARPSIPATAWPRRRCSSPAGRRRRRRRARRSRPRRWRVTAAAPGGAERHAAGRLRRQPRRAAAGDRRSRDRRPARRARWARSGWPGRAWPRGYWNRPEETGATFGARLAERRRADLPAHRRLGFLADGELFVTGRLKDLIILRGRNHYPQDIELDRRGEPSGPARRRRGGVFGRRGRGERRAAGGGAEVERAARGGLAAVDRGGPPCRSPRSTRRRSTRWCWCGLATMPKTSSGKIQRGDMRANSTWPARLRGGRERRAAACLAGGDGAGARSSLGPTRRAAAAEAPGRPRRICCGRRGHAFLPPRLPAERGPPLFEPCLDRQPRVGLGLGAGEPSSRKNSGRRSAWVVVPLRSDDCGSRNRGSSRGDEARHLAALVRTGAGRARERAAHPAASAPSGSCNGWHRRARPTTSPPPPALRSQWKSQRYTVRSKAFSAPFRAAHRRSRPSEDRGPSSRSMHRGGGLYTTPRARVDR